MPTTTDGPSEFYDEQWLARTTEEILDPSLPIVDAHHHLMTWPVHYLLPELLGDLGSGHNVVATVHIEAHGNYRSSGPEHLKPVGETEFLVQAAREAAAVPGAPRVCAGIVGAADLMLGAAVEEVLEAHLTASDGRFRGVRINPFWRFSAAGDLSLAPGWDEVVDRPELLAGIEKLRAHGLLLELVCFAPGLSQVARLAARFPDLVIVVDHMGAPVDPGPSPRPLDELLAAWRADLDAAAAQPNVRIKLGGLGSAFVARSLPQFQALRAGPRPPSSAQLAETYRPLVSDCIDRFGPGRCMFESNFPMDKQTSSYAVEWNAFKRLARTYSEPERRALLSGVAAATYGVDA